MKNCEKFVTLNAKGLVTDAELKELICQSILPFYAEIELGWKIVNGENSSINYQNDTNYSWNYNFDFNKSNSSYSHVLKSKQDFYNYLTTDFMSYAYPNKMDTIKELYFFYNYISDNIEEDFSENMYCDNTGLCIGMTCSNYNNCMVQ